VGLQTVLVSMSHRFIFASFLMKKGQKIYSVFQKGSAVVMIAALLWLTISAPFVYATLQALANLDKDSNTISLVAGTEEEASAPISNAAEEKVPNSSLSEEYLHHHYNEELLFSLISQLHKCESPSHYVNHCGELLVPPPNQA